MGMSVTLESVPQSALDSHYLWFRTNLCCCFFSSNINSWIVFYSSTSSVSY